MKKLLLALILSSFITVTALPSTDVSAKHDPQLLVEIMSKIWSIANVKVQELQKDYCPDDLVYNGLMYLSRASSQNEVTFKFAENNYMSYCNDGAPKYCLISVRLQAGKWSIENSIVSCLVDGPP